MIDYFGQRYVALTGLRDERVAVWIGKYLLFPCFLHKKRGQPLQSFCFCGKLNAVLCKIVVVGPFLFCRDIQRNIYSVPKNRRGMRPWQESDSVTVVGGACKRVWVYRLSRRIQS